MLIFARSTRAVLFLCPARDLAYAATTTSEDSFKLEIVVVVFRRVLVDPDRVLLTMAVTSNLTAAYLIAPEMKRRQDVSVSNSFSYLRFSSPSLNIYYLKKLDLQT